MKKRLQLFFLFLLGITLFCNAQEICDNAIDDDGDGLIDLNDWADCQCDGVSPPSLILNSSFEEMTCCPTANEQLDCAVDWGQASGATTDYVHTCDGYLGNTSIPAFAPLPFPDGEGAVGFRDGQVNIGPIYKEYVGACLTEPMEVGVTYRFDFYLGFRDNVPGSTNLDIALFASTSCVNLPFGGAGSFETGCPTNTPGYIQWDEQNISGSNEWVRVIFQLTPTQPYEVVVLGPSCVPNPNYLQDPYFYLDRLTLAKVSDFSNFTIARTGSICEDDLVLEVPFDPEATYQWYQDGIAMLGETNSTLGLTMLNNTAGDYQAFITTTNDCSISNVYSLITPPYYGIVESSICENEFIVLGTDTLTEAGFYEELLVASDGCDSIVQLTLDVLTSESILIVDTVCGNVSYLFNGIELLEGGVFDTVLTNSHGCDSLVTLELHHINLGVGVEIADSINLKLGEVIDLFPSFFDDSFTNFIWTDENGNVLGEGKRIDDYQPLFSSVVYLEASNDHGCSIIDMMDLNVLPNYKIYVPNAFSPDGNGVNDFFKFYPELSLARVLNFSVFNRWGGLVFRNSDIVNFQNYEGWDGTKKGEDAPIGIYTYMLEVEYLDGVRELLSGDVTLLR